MKLKPASCKEIPELVQLMKELGYSSNAHQIEERISEIRQRQGDVIIAVDDQDQIIGCIQALIAVRLAEGKIGEIVSLVVKSSERAKGTGSELLREAKGRLHQAGCTTVRIRANAVREIAHEFYKKHGFKEIKTQKIFQIELVK